MSGDTSHHNVMAELAKYFHLPANANIYAFPEESKNGSLQHLLEWCQRLERLRTCFQHASDLQIIECITCSWNRHLPYFTGWDDKVRTLRQADEAVTLSHLYDHIASLVAPHSCPQQEAWQTLQELKLEAYPDLNALAARFEELLDIMYKTSARAHNFKLPSKFDVATVLVQLLWRFSATQPDHVVSRWLMVTNALPHFSAELTALRKSE
jgi:hypothetical protein